MSEVLQIEALPRERVGKGGSRALRREGRVPGVLYGEGADPVLFSVDAAPLRKAFAGGHFMNTLCELAIGGETVRVLPKEVQTDPVKDLPIHVDFLRIGRGARITLTIPVDFVGEDRSPGLKRGGVLNIVRREIEVVCPADAIPEALVLDLSGADIGDSLHFSDVQVPDGVLPTITDRDFTVVSVTPPTVATAADEGEEEAPEEEAEAEGEGEEER
jgi:large subunit ribosomal protein L25